MFLSFKWANHRAQKIDRQSTLKTAGNVPVFHKRGYPVSVVQAGNHRAQQIDRQSALKPLTVCQFFDKRGYPVSFVEAGHHRALQIYRHSALQTAQKENAHRIPVTHIYPHNHVVKSIILKNFKLLQSDSKPCAIFSQPPISSFKRE